MEFLQLERMFFQFDKSDMQGIQVPGSSLNHAVLFGRVKQTLNN